MTTSYKANDDWNKPEKRPATPISTRRLRTEKSKVARACVECGEPFYPWKCGPGICCSRRCRSRHNLKKRSADEMGTLYRQEKLDTNGAKP